MSSLYFTFSFFFLIAEGFHVMIEAMVDNDIFSTYKIGGEAPLPIFDR